MNALIKVVALTAVTLALVGKTSAAEETITGKWKGQFESQIGIQKYTFEFKVDGTNVTGTALGEREMGTNEVKLIEGKLNKDEITFVEPLKFQDNEIRIEYAGKIKGDEIKFHRKVGEFAEEDFVAKRVTGDSGTETKVDAKSPGSSSTNSPPR
jgi:hypothetical protein